MSKIVVTINTLKSQKTLESSLELSSSDRYEIMQDLITLLRGAVSGESVSLDIEYSDAPAEATDQDVSYVARDAGTQGNDIVINLVDPAAADAPLAISVSGKEITVQLATDGDELITTTGALLAAALNAFDASAALVIASSEATDPLAEATVSLANGTDQSKTLKFNIA